MSKPDFFIIGAPKCGTTSLASWLSEHPGIFMSPLKEPNYFNTDEQVRFRPSEKRYESLFKLSNEQHRRIGEASTRYFASRQAIKNILDYSPDARFVVMLRNPIEMAPSLHEQTVFKGDEDVDDFEQAWQLQGARAEGKNIPADCVEPGLCQYGYICELGRHLERTLKLVDRSRVHVILLDDLRADSLAVYRQLLVFLDVPDDGRKQFPVLNAAKEVRSRWLFHLTRALWLLKSKLGVNRSFGIAAQNQLNRARKPITEAMRKELSEYFSADVRKLETILHRDFSAWLCVKKTAPGYSEQSGS
jgi:hypothetical protein